MYSKIALNVKGKNINRFIKKLTNKKIDILTLKYINKNEINIIIYNRDLEKVLKIKSIYDVLETDVYGPLKLKKILKINIHLITILIIVFISFILLTNMIFKVEVIHTDKDLRDLLICELKNYDIKKYSFKKSYDTITKIKKEILNKYPNKIEWLEIENTGTKYTVRVEEREKKPLKKENVNRDLIAKKDAVIKKIYVKKGEIVKDVEMFVKKGETIVSGRLYVYEKEKGQVHAIGKVYGEVWYVLKIDYPFIYSEEKETGNKKENYVIKVFNKEIDLSKKHYKTKKYEETSILSHPLLPIKFIYQKQKETKVINDVLTFDQALNKAQDTLTNKVKNRLKKDEYIIKSKYLKSKVLENTIKVEMFFSVYEDITDYKEIKDNILLK